MKVEKLGDRVYRVTPVEEGKKPRLVRFHIDIEIECFDPSSHEGCDANDHDRWCSHAEAALGALMEELLDADHE